MNNINNNNNNNRNISQKIPEDKRDKLWSEIESKIQVAALNKDPKAVSLLPKKYKKYLRTQDGMKIYSVNGPWIYHNLSVIFGHGGHAFVHEFIPHGEIWIATTHHNCKCNVPKGTTFSQGYFDSTTLHEITEYKEMKKGKSYWEAHNIALNAERKAKYKIDSREIL